MTRLIANSVKRLNDALLDPIDGKEMLVALIVENIPEWKRLLGCKQHNIHDYNLDEHTLLVINKIRTFDDFKNLKEYDKLVLLYSALLHDIDKKENEVDPQHPQRGAEKAISILFRLGFSEDFINRVFLLVKYHQILGLMASGRILFSFEELAEIYKESVIIEQQKILSIADIKSVKKDEMFFNETMNEKIHEIVDKIKNLL